MSLRLPSQNKFRPTARPGMKKAPTARPASSATSLGQPKATVLAATPDQTQQTVSQPSQLDNRVGSSQTAVASSSAAPASSSTVVPSQTQVSSSAGPSKSPIKALGTTSTPTKAAAGPIVSPNKPAVTPIGAPSIVSTDAPSRASPQPPRLSLLDAARSHSATAASPGAIRRGTPSVSSRSVRAPSATPQPMRAPSLPPSQAKPTSAKSQTTSMPPPPLVSRRPRETSSTPQPTALPPSLGVTASPSEGPLTGHGLPPSLGTAQAAPETASRGPSQSDTAALAAALVASIGTNIPAPRRPRKPPRKAKPQNTSSALDGSGAVEQASSAASQPAKRNRQSFRASTEVRGSSEDADQGEDGYEEGSGSEGESDGSGGVKGGSSHAGSQVTRRPNKRSRSSKPKKPSVSVITLQEFQPDEMVGAQVDEVSMTMGDLATTLAAQGRITQRAIKIDEFRRNEAIKKREESRLRAQQLWRRNQIQRRKVRATRNGDRARRRREMGEAGDEEDDVSADEDDSEEEFEAQPDRLTPESTPEPELRMDSQAPERSELGEEDEERDREDWELEYEAAQREAAGDDEEPEFVPEAGDGVSQVGDGVDLALAQAAEEDEDMAALRAAGFLVTDDRGDGERGDGDDADEADWFGTEEPDIDAYRQALEQRRRRVIEEHDRDDQEVVEVDDETRFINSQSYSKYTKPQRWTALDTELFYQVLEETGENYTLMKAYFPGRTIKQLKLKGLRENRANPDRMTEAILARKPMDKAYLTKSAGYNPNKAWDREEALFEEARVDADKLKRMDSVRPEEEGQGGRDGEGDGEVGLEQMAMEDEKGSDQEAEDDGRDDKSGDEAEPEFELPEDEE
ncbi:hypothetical protein IAU60_003999 [Kwoniella sp. DSM 27419]